MKVHAPSSRIDSVWSRHGQAGFSLLELITVMALSAILISMALPHFSSMHNQLDVAEDTRALAMKIAELRAEAVRLRANVRVSFSNGGVSWDIYNDGSVDGTLDFHNGIEWSGGSAPTPILFNGLGLIPALAAQKKLTLNRDGIRLTVNVNPNGHVEL